MAEATPKLAACNKRLRTCTGWTILFMVVLRIAIGWHFLYEGVWKIKSGMFSATPYLLASSGPLKDVFRSMVDDADGFKRMGVVRDEKGEVTGIKPDFQKAAIDKRLALVTEFYSLDPDQQKALRDLAEKKKKELDDLYGVTPRMVAMPTYNLARENDTRARYGLPPSTRPADLDAGVAGANVKLPDEDLFAQVVAYDRLVNQARAEEKSHETKYLLQRMEFNNAKISGSRNAILARVEKPCKDVTPLGAPDIDQRARLTPEDLKFIRERDGGVELTEDQFAKGPLPLPQAQHFPGKQLSQYCGMPFKATTRTEWQDFGMMFGLCAIGACLILGLFTRLAAFGAVTFLAMFYFSMPPWPGVPDVPPLEGHYLIVNKNLVELFACLMIMTSGVGRWFGLDAFLGAIRDRRRRRKFEALAVSAQAGSGRMSSSGARPVARDTARV